MRDWNQSGLEVAPALASYVASRGTKICLRQRRSTGKEVETRDRGGGDADIIQNIKNPFQLDCFKG